jgi:hypothetical protein
VNVLILFNLSVHVPSSTGLKRNVGKLALKGKQRPRAKQVKRWVNALFDARKVLISTPMSPVTSPKDSPTCVPKEQMD